MSNSRFLSSDTILSRKSGLGGGNASLFVRAFTLLNRCVELPELQPALPLEKLVHSLLERLLSLGCQFEVSSAANVRFPPQEAMTAHGPKPNFTAFATYIRSVPLGKISSDLSSMTMSHKVDHHAVAEHLRGVAGGITPTDVE